MNVRQLPQTLALQRQLIQQLADGKTHSGEALAQQAGISRAAIAKHISQLQQIGLEIFAISGKGYRLAQPLRVHAGQVIAQRAAQQCADRVAEHALGGRVGAGDVTFR